MKPNKVYNSIKPTRYIFLLWCGQYRVAIQTQVLQTKDKNINIIFTIPKSNKIMTLKQTFARVVWWRLWKRPQYSLLQYRTPNPYGHCNS